MQVISSQIMNILGTRLEVQTLQPEVLQPGPTLVFLHEGLGSVALWRDWPARLCARLGCAGLVYSRQGYGQSAITPDVRGPSRIQNGQRHGRLLPDYMHREALDVLPALLRTHPLLEQLRFYPALDPNGDAKRWLQEKVKQQRANNTVSSSQLPSFQGTGLGMVPAGYNPLRPGGWLMQLLTPPAAAATLDSQGGGRYGGGPFMDDPRWATGPARPVSHPETGTGYTVPGARDANGRPVVFSKSAASKLLQMNRGLAGSNNC